MGGQSDPRIPGATWCHLITNGKTHMWLLHWQQGQSLTGNDPQNLWCWLIVNLASALDDSLMDSYLVFINGRVMGHMDRDRSRTKETTVQFNPTHGPSQLKFLMFNNWQNTTQAYRTFQSAEVTKWVKLFGCQPHDLSASLKFHEVVEEN